MEDQEQYLRFGTFIFKYIRKEEYLNGTLVINMKHIFYFKNSQEKVKG